MENLRIDGEIFELTTSAQRLAEKANLQINQLFASVKGMQSEGVFEDMLTPTRQFGVDLIRDAIQRRDDYQDPSRVARRAGALLERLNKLDHGVDLRRLNRVERSMRTKESLRTKKNSWRLLHNVEEQVAPVLASAWMCHTGDAPIPREVRKLVRDKLKSFSKTQQSKAFAFFDAALELLDVMTAPQSAANVNRVFELFVATGQIPESAYVQFQSRPRPRATIREVGKTIPNLGNSNRRVEMEETPMKPLRMPEYVDVEIDIVDFDDDLNPIYGVNTDAQYRLEQSSLNISDDSLPLMATCEVTSTGSRFTKLRFVEVARRDGTNG